MALLSGRCRLGLELARLFAVTAAIAAFGIPARGADVNVTIDQALLLKLPDRVATIIIGNPLITDATIQTGGAMVITGKGYGMTNLIALDRAGTVLMEKSVEVRGPSDVVLVYRGIERESYSCTPSCERRATLGDTAAYFDAVIGQIGSRTGQGQAAPAAPGK